MAHRQCFKLASGGAVRWFPGHMGKGLKQMQQRLKLVDCVIEVHDARIPISGRNAEFQRTIIGDGVKPHILVLNKKDLADWSQSRSALQKSGNQHVIFTNAKDQRCPGLRRILPLAQELIESSERYNRTGEKDLSVMIVGVPNVGKSSLVNALRNIHLHRKGASQVGALAGVTRSVLERIRISDDPRMYMIDTPGILEPRITDDEMGMKLALVGCLPDHHVGEDVIAEYLLYWLNRSSRYDYVPVLGLKQPTEHIGEALIALANKLGVQRKRKNYEGQLINMPDILLAARRFVSMFRRGDLGLVDLDWNMHWHR